MTDPEELEGRVEEHQALAAPGLQRHPRVRVPAEPQREPAQHGEGSADVDARQKKALNAPAAEPKK